MRYGVGETLAKFDEQMKPQPWIASKWEVSPDHKTWTFTINDKVKFSNGKKVDAAAVKASIERALKNPIVRKHSSNMTLWKLMVNN